MLSRSSGRGEPVTRRSLVAFRTASHRFAVEAILQTVYLDLCNSNGQLNMEKVVPERGRDIDAVGYPTGVNVTRTRGLLEVRKAV